MPNGVESELKMSTDLRIYTQTFQDNENDFRTITKTQVIETICDQETIEQITEKGFKNWHVLSDCGFECELTGEELKEIIHNPVIIDDEYYRCEISY